MELLVDTMKMCYGTEGGETIFLVRGIIFIGTADCSSNLYFLMVFKMLLGVLQYKGVEKI